MQETPPQNTDIEITLLGTILAFNEYQELIIPNLKAKMFYKEVHVKIFDAIDYLYQRNEAIDMLTCTQLLRERNHIDEIGGAYYISSLTSNIGSGLNYETHIRVLKELYIKRNMIQLFTTGTRDVLTNDKDIAEIFNIVSNGLNDIFNITSTNVNNMYKVMSDRLLEIERLKPGQLLGVTSGIKSLDSITGGWQGGDMIVLAARPSMGKTIVSTMLAKTPALQGKTVLYFSLEMPAQRIADRIISLDTGINSKKLQSNNLHNSDWLQIEDNVLRYKDCNFLINDEASITIEQITNITLIESKNNKIDLILIDYMGLIKPSFKSGSTNDKVSHISRNIKGLAKKINVPVIALSQLSREVDKRSDKRPIMSDLRDSGSIEQDADLVIFLYRDDYYYPELEDNKNKIEVLIRKHRTGEIGMTYLYRNDNWSNIRDEETEEMPEYEDKF